MTDASGMHPRIALMHRYVEDYTNGHDLRVAREIMHPDYEFTMSGRTIGLEEYLSMVEWAFGKFPDLRLSVQRFVFNETADGSGGRLAMEFRESATSPKHGRGGSWPGISLYRFHEDGRLLSVEVEQDFWGRLDQLEGKAPGRPMAPTDPSVWTAEPQQANVETEAMVREWLGDPAAFEAAGGDGSDAKVVIDDGNALAIRPEDVVIDDMFSAGWDFAVKVHLQGLHPESGGVVTLPATGMGSIDPNGPADVRIVTDRYGTLSR